MDFGAAFEERDLVGPELLDQPGDRGNRITARQQRIEPGQRDFGGLKGAGEAFGCALGGEREACGAGEGRGAAPAHPGKELMPLARIPAAHQLAGFEAWVVLQANGFKRIIADVHRPQAAQAARCEPLCYGLGEKRHRPFDPRQRDLLRDRGAGRGGGHARDNIPIT